MKKLIIFIITAAMAASLGLISFAAEDREIDVSGLTTTSDQAAVENWPEAGWTDDAVVKLVNYGDAVNLGAIDLTQYKSITILYGRDNTHATDANAGIVLSNKAVQNKDASLADDAVIYADFTDKMDHEKQDPAISWKAFQDKEGELTVSIDASNYEAGTDVWLSAKVLGCADEHSGENGDNPAAIGYGVTLIRFNADEMPEMPEIPETGNGQQGNTNTGDTFTVILMISVFLMAATVLIKNRSY